MLQSLGLEAGPAVRVGFRVRDVIVDPLLHRSFVRVEACGHPDRALLILPFASASAGQALDPVPAQSPLHAGSMAAPLGREVQVSMLSERANVRMSGKLVRSGTVGERVEVELAALVSAGDAPKRVTGLLVTPDRVEVRP